MKSIVVSMIAAAGLMIAGSAMAAEPMPELAKKSNCTSCHAMDKKVVGPAWNDIAKKYRGQADAEAKLITKVAKGGSGAWGTMPMPPNAPKVSEADIKTLVEFILNIK